DVPNARVSEVPLPAIALAIDEMPVATLRQQSSDRLVGSTMRGGGISGARMRSVDHPDRRIGEKSLDDRYAVAGQRSVLDARAITFPGWCVPHPQTRFTRPGGSAGVAVVKLGSADRVRALGRVEPAQRLGESITTRVTANEGQVVRLVLIGHTPALVALTVSDLNVHRAREPQHAEVRLNLIQIQDHPDITLSDQLLERPAAARKSDRKTAAAQHQIAGVRPVDDHEDGPLLR